MTKLRRVLFFLASAFSVLVLALVFAMWFFFSRGCGGNAEAASLLRALPEEQLASLYGDIQALRGGETNAIPSAMTFPPDVAPKELAALNPKSLQISGGTARIHISGCHDDKVYLFLHGLGSAQDKGTIVLHPGEAQDAETLWEQQ